MKESIAFKLWLLIVILVSITLIVVGFSLHTLLEDLYFDLQARAMVEQGRNIEEIMRKADSREELSNLINTVGDFIDSHIMVVNTDGMVGICNPGMPMQPGMNFNCEEVEEVLRGNVVIRRGKNFGFEKSMLMAAVPVQEKGEVLAAIILFKPVDPITKAVNDFRRLIFGTAIGAIILAIILSFFLARKITGPLLKINDFARRVAAGDFSGRIPVETGDEVGNLAKTFNYMSEELENAENLRRQFLSDVSHELRTPLSLLQGYAEALADDMAATEEERKEYLTVISDEAARINRIVDDLSDLNAMEAGKLTLNISEFSISDVLKNVVRTFKPAAEDKNIALDFKAPAGYIPPLRGDQGRIEQIFINLVSNAVNYTPAGGKVIVEVKYDGDHFLIKVSDTGEGISPHELPRIWERFYRVDKARTRKEGGTGLGLAIVKNLVEAHGGTVTVSSKPGEGSTFTVTFPANPSKGTVRNH